MRERGTKRRERIVTFSTLGMRLMYLHDVYTVELSERVGIPTNFVFVLGVRAACRPRVPTSPIDTSRKVRTKESALRAQ
jgi:hypothetical protein